MESTLRRSTLTVALLIGLVGATTAAAQASGNGGSLNPDDPRVQDAREYALDQDVELSEALRRLELQREAGELEAELSEHERGSFAGLFIQHSPQFRVVVQLTRGGPERIEPYVADGPLAGQVEVRPAQRSLARLEAAQRSAHSTTRALGVPADSEIDVRANRVELSVSDKGRLTDALRRSARALPAEVTVIGAEELARPAANLFAGLALSSCTSGFSVQFVGFVDAPGTGEPGTTTAGHCGNALSYEGLGLRFKAEAYSGPRDVQWHAQFEHTVRNWAYDGIPDEYTPNYRTITATRSRTNQVVGEFVCKYGKTTGRTCGFIKSRSYQPSYVPNATATYIRVHRDDWDLSMNGDSGSPWYFGGTAYGINSGGIGDAADTDRDAIYMAVNYLDALGLRVLTK